ncbi:hypothetical protein E5O75_00640 [Neisseria gonorrhoeae]|nr:hypothetical protein BB039_00825 [Neisseria gonorrhoeae]OIA72565.1 hypothetical protein BB038_01895 [Neisseria gonorrhoeae]OIA83421.1 hypothetical protein BB028_01420 [Neisseria gonorrhoeae]OZV76100.1 hypothetical protein CA773_00640 [Neisseria gonorrhoeae]QIH18920.1 hypothetical protein F0T10_02100 [Neisseria gonorrhoeae]
MIKILVWILKVNYALNATQRNATQRNATQRNATQRNSTIIFNGKVIVWDSCFVFSVIMPQNNRKPPLFVS